MEKELIKEYNRIAESIAAYFCSKYFNSLDYYWIGKKVGETLNIGDYFFSLNDMLDYLRYKYEVDKMFEHYEYALEEATHDRYPICIRDWKKLK